MLLTADHLSRLHTLSFKSSVSETWRVVNKGNSAKTLRQGHVFCVGGLPKSHCSQNKASRGRDREEVGCEIRLALQAAALGTTSLLLCETRSFGFCR